MRTKSEVFIRSMTGRSGFDPLCELLVAEVSDGKPVLRDWARCCHSMASALAFDGNVRIVATHHSLASGLWRRASIIA